MRRFRFAWLAVALVSGSGCEGDRSAGMRESDMASAPTAAARFMPTAKSEAAPAEADEASKALQGRKIIFTADVAITVEDFVRAEKAMTALVTAQGGYLAESNVSGSPGEHRSGTWKARVPVDHFRTLVDGIAELGELTSSRTTSEDVSDEYFDLEARIKNKAAEEARLVRHLEISTGKLDEILQVEREISRVRGEIERMQGRKQVLANLTSLTTVAITIHERRGFVPPEAPTFATQMARSFQGSVDTLVGLGVGFSLFVAALVPFLPLFLLFALMFVLARSRWRAYQRRVN